MTIVKLELPGYPTPTFDHLWRSNTGIRSTLEDLRDLWFRAARGDVDIEVEENASSSVPPLSEARVQELRVAA